MYQRIVVATDGSEQATQAVEFLAKLAWRDAAMQPTIWVVAVSRDAAPPRSRGPHAGVVADARRYLELTHQEKLQKARAIVATAASRLREGLAGSGHVEEVVRVGEPTREVLALASEVQADLIAAGARGRHGVRELLLGSTSEGLVTEASCPVLIVRQTPPVLSEVLIAAATPEDAERLTAATLALPLPPSIKIVAATVVRSGQDLPPVQEAGDPEVERLHDALRQLGDDEGATAQAAIERIVALTQARGYATEALVLRGDAGDTLLETAAERGTCLIVVGARERSGLGGWLGLGSVSRKLVRRTGSAVLVVRPS